MNPMKLKRLFPHASKSFSKLNTDSSHDTGMSNESKSLDRKEVCETQRSKEMGTEYRLSHVHMDFNASHGHKLDQDNSRYTIKVVLDALVNLGFAKDDKEITSEVTQRMDKTYFNI